MQPTPRYISPWPLWKRALQKLWEAFEMGDHEYYRFRFGRFPFNVAGTVYEEDYRRRGFRRVFPWRIRFGWAGLLRQYVCGRCTLCHARFSLRELLSRDGSLTHFQSGSICHRVCSDVRRTSACTTGHSNVRFGPGTRGESGPYDL